MAIKIAWNDGHTLTGLGTGAVGIIKETDRNRRVGTKAKNILLNEYEGVTIIDCTINSSDNDMRDAVNKANSNNCDVFISNHVNAGGGVGFETFYSRKSTASNINRANIIHNRICNTKSCLANRRCTDDFSYKGYDLYVLINTVMEAHLFELGFVDNQTCVNAFNDDEVARALAEGIAQAYNISKKIINEGVKFNMKNVVVYTRENEFDGLIAEMWASVLDEGVAVNNHKVIDYSKVENIYAVGGNIGTYTAYLKPENFVIGGSNRWATLRNFQAKIGK